MIHIFNMLISLMLFLAISANIFTGIAIASELRPLPDPKSFRQEAPIESQDRVDESVYKDFESRVRSLDKKEKEKLMAAFSEKREEAIKNNRQDEAKHYERLLGILSTK